MISSFARPTPTTCGSREEPPTSGTSPKRVSGRPTNASSAITRRSQASASSSAPPRQTPWIAQTVGLGISSARFQASRQSRRNARRLLGLARGAGERGDVHAGGEDRAVAAQDDDAYRRVVGGGAQGRADGEHELLVERVALLGAVEDDVADRLAILRDDEVGHGE